MSWFYVDDGFSDSKPMMNLPTTPVRVPMRIAVAGAWVLGGSWSAKEETDGFIPHAKLKSLLVPRSVVAAMCAPGPFDASLCCPESDGISVKNWAKWQQTKAENQARRKRDAERKHTQRCHGRNFVNSVNNQMSQVDNTGDINIDSKNVSHVESQGPTPPLPIDTHLGSESSRNVAGERGLPDTVESSASQLVHQIVPSEHPAAVKTALGIKASELMGTGTTTDVLAEALRAWVLKPGVGPGVLPSLVSDVIKARAGATGRPPHKLRIVAELAARVRAEEQTQLANQASKGVTR